jgi:rhodanese-related sulfurtransferase
MIKNLTVKDAHQKQADGYTYVDVRSIPEFEQAHPAGALNVPLLHRDPATGQMSPNLEFVEVMKGAFAPDAKLLIGCQAGARSAQAAQLLSAAGFTDVTNVLGGFGGARDQMTGVVRAEGWVQAGLPVETSAAPGATYAEVRAQSAKGTR